MVTARVFGLAVLVLPVLASTAADDACAIMHPIAVYGRRPAVADEHALLRTVTVSPGSQNLLP